MLAAKATRCSSSKGRRPSSEAAMSCLSTFIRRLSGNQSFVSRYSIRDNLSRMLYLDTKLWLPDNLLMKVDKQLMAASLEGRLPLLDEHLVAFAASIPSHLKIHGWQTKYILKRAYADFLPPEILR